MSATTAVEADGHSGGFWMLVLGSIGVVYGDIGTSPLYAMREALHSAGRDGLVEEEVIGITSMLVWTLILIVTFKYIGLILRADNRGEGGTLSLLALAQRSVGRRTPILLVRLLLGLEPDRARQRLVSTVEDELPSWLEGLRVEGVRAFGRNWVVSVDRGRVTISEGV